MTIAARLAGLRAALPAGVTLVAVSKTQPPEAIREAYAAGQRHFGENYAQEWRAKAEALADLPDLDLALHRRPADQQGPAAGRAGPLGPHGGSAGAGPRALPPLGRRRRDA